MVIKPLPKVLDGDENGTAFVMSHLCKTVDQLVEGYNRHDEMLKALDKLSKILHKMSELDEKDQQTNSV
jgi:hypothetical protein